MCHTATDSLATASGLIGFFNLFYRGLLFCTGFMLSNG